MGNPTMDVSRDLQGIARDLDKAIQRAAGGQRMAFTLIVFTPGRVSYVSNAKREESVREIKHLLGLWGEGMPDVPAHEVG